MGSPQMWIPLWRRELVVRGTERQRVEAHPAAESWEQFRQTLRGHVTPVTWRTWLDGLRPESIDDTVIHITAPSEFHLRWVNEKFRPLVEDAVGIAFGSGLSVELSAPAEPAYEPILEEDPEPDELNTVPAGTGRFRDRRKARTQVFVREFRGGTVKPLRPRGCDGDR